MPLDPTTGAATNPSDNGTTGDPSSVVTTDQYVGWLSQANGGIQGNPATVGAKFTGDPNASTRYTFGNGTYIVVKTNQGDGSYSIVGGNALTTGKPLAANQTRLQVRMIDGNPYNYDPSTGTMTAIQGIPPSATAAQKMQIAQQRADAASENADTAAQRAAAGQQRADTGQQKVDQGSWAEQQANNLAQAKFAWEKAQAEAKAALEADPNSLPNIKDRLAEQHAAISEQLALSAQALTQRGQDLSFGSAMSGQATTALDSALAHSIPNGQLDALNSAMGGVASQSNLPFKPTPQTPFTYNPLIIPEQVAQRAIANLQSGGNQSAAATTQGTPANFIPPNFSATAGAGNQGFTPLPATQPGFTPMPFMPQTGRE